MEQLCVCGTMAPIAPSDGPLVRFIRHLALCGAVCAMGNANGEGFKHGEKTHDPPWEGPPETDGHYHGECPNGCFKDCCKPPGNLCGPKCQQCFGCRKCDRVHSSDQVCRPSYR